MDSGRGPTEDVYDSVWPLMEQAASLDAYLDQLGGDRRPAPRQLTLREAAVRMAAAQLRLVCEGIEEPAPEFLQALDGEVGRTLRQEQRRLDVSRKRFLRRSTQFVAATGLVAAGAAADELARHLQQREGLVAGPGRWYDVAAADELSSGHVKHFSAGGVLGFLVNDGGRLHAVSAICTHMGCRLKPAQSHLGFHCPCHGARFDADGAALDGLAPGALPRVDVRVVGGRVYARGTAEDV